MKEKVEKFFQELREIDIRKVNIPEHAIPGWPNDLKIRIDLTPRFHLLWFGKRKINFIVNSKSDQYQFKDKRVRAFFYIDPNGSYGVKFWEMYDDYGKEYDSHSSEVEKRINALYIFQTYFDFIYKKVISQIKDDIKSNDEVIDTVEKAFEPFIPYYTADVLSK